MNQHQEVISSSATPFCTRKQKEQYKKQINKLQSYLFVHKIENIYFLYIFSHSQQAPVVVVVVT
jgi:hypothetical protein